MEEKNFVIREATLEDLSTLRKFEAGIIDHERAFDSTIKDTGIVQYQDIKRLLADNKTKFLIAELNGHPIGCGFGSIKKSPEYVKNTEYGYLGLIFVSEEARGQRLAGKIIDQLKTWFLENNIQQLRLGVYAKNHGAIKAYERNGFAGQTIEMVCSLKK